MTDPAWRPLPDDPDGSYLLEVFDARAETWILSDDGDYQTGAAETWKNDGTGHQEVVVLEWPGRYNNSREQVTVRMMMHPEDALGLAEVLRHTGTWMIRRRGTTGAG